MKKVIRLTESDLLRIVKRVIKEQQTGTTVGTQTVASDINPQIKKYLNTNQAIPAEWVIKTPFNNSESDVLKLGTIHSKDPMTKMRLEEYQKLKSNDAKSKMYLDSIMMSLERGQLILQPYNNGEQVGEYGAKYMKKDSLNLILVSCTKEKPCRAGDFTN